MKIKDIFTKTGPITGYFGYIILLFGWNLANDVYTSMQPELTGSVIHQILSWMLRILVVPVIYAGVFGGIHEQQRTQHDVDVFARNGFFSNIAAHYWRFIAANFLSLIFYFVFSMIAFLLGGEKLQDSDASMIIVQIIAASLSAINLFWFSAIVVERNIFRGLSRSIKMLLHNPHSLAIGIIWTAIYFADTFFFEFKSEQVPLATNIARSGVFAILRVLATMVIFVVYKNIWGSEPSISENNKIPAAVSTTRPGEKLANASFGFTFVSFLPLLHLVALILGVLALKRSQRFSLKAAAACWMGGFFTILYALALAGFLAGQSNPLRMPDYTFLADANAEAETYVSLLKQDAVSEVRAQLEESSAFKSDRDWTFDTALALAKYNNNDIEEALPDFYTALQKEPDRSEFYFYYGMALLDSNKADMALEQFQLALAHEPKLEIAEKYIALIQNAYKPSSLASALMYIVILLILFTLHEYGHAFAAWKLGDDTARNLGRVTFNPLAHLDLFGSILLPGLLLLQQSGTIFGWAKPVPVNPENFKNPNRDHMLVSFAGPAVNLMVAMVCMVVLALMAFFLRVLWPGSISLNLMDPSTTTYLIGPPLAKWILILIVFIKDLLYTSLILGFLNLIPVPPLDGSWILAGILPEGLRGIFMQARRFGFLFFILLSMTPLLNSLLSIPVSAAWLGLHLLSSAIGFA